MKRAESCSKVQQLAEGLMITALSQEINCPLVKYTLPLPQTKTKVCVDGFHRNNNKITLAEAWAHIGKAKSAQRNKVLADILKLALAKVALQRSDPGLTVKCHIAFADDAAASVLCGKSWAALAAQEFGIRCSVVHLCPEVIERIRDAQKRQDLRMPADE